MNLKELSYKTVLLEREIAKYKILINNYENNINLFNQNIIQIEQIPLSKINEMMKITSELNNLKKELNLKIKDLEMVQKIIDTLQKPKLQPIVSEIITPAPPKPTPNVVLEQITVPKVHFSEEVQIKEIEQTPIVDFNNIYNSLNNLQEQINSIMNRLSNLEIKN